MQKRVFEGLILGAVLIAAIIAFWIIINEPVGKAGMPPPKKYPPSLWDEPVVPWESTPSPSEEPSPSPSLYDEPVVPWERTPPPSEEPTQSPSPSEEPRIPWDETPYPSPSPSESPTQYPSPSPSEESTPTPDYTLQTNNFCNRAKRILDGIFKPKKKPIAVRCSGSYDPETGDYSGTLEFTFTAPN